MADNTVKLKETKAYPDVKLGWTFVNRDKTKRLGRCRKALGKPAQPKIIRSNWPERLYRLTGIDPSHPKQSTASIKSLTWLNTNYSCAKLE